jgi:DNA transformation protein and related proteins
LNSAAIEDIFAPVGRVTFKNMFGGAGVYLKGLCIAIIFDDMIWLKADESTIPAFQKAGSRAFSYEKKSGEVSVMSFWLIPDKCFDDEEELKHFATLAENAAMRALQRKLIKKPKAPKKNAH